MKLNVLLYGSTANPLGIPATWPAQVQEVPDSAPAAIAPWQQMTVAAYQAYVATHQVEYDAWQAAQQSAKDSNLSTLASQYDTALTSMQNAESNWGTLTQAQILAVAHTHNQVLLKLLPVLRKFYMDSLQ